MDKDDITPKPRDKKRRIGQTPQRANGNFSPSASNSLNHNGLTSGKSMTRRRLYLPTTTMDVNKSVTASGDMEAKLDSFMSKMDTHYGEICGKLDGINTNIKTLVGIMDTVESKVDRLDYICLDIDIRARRHNVVIYGVPENETDDEHVVNTVKLFSAKTLDIADTIEVTHAYRVGAYRAERSRPIVATMSREDHLNWIITAARPCLPGTEQRVSRDYPNSLRDARRQLGRPLREARDEGKDA